ncbi:MAG: hypothetical protein ACAH95_03860 [Fimbriimonas sp.]
MPRLKLSAFEEEIWDAWEALAFESGGFAGKPQSRQELEAEQRRQLPAWDELLGRIHDGEQWTVGLGTALAVTHSRWHNAMILRDYERAVVEIDRALTHPSKLSRHDLSELPIYLQVARMGAGFEGNAALSLERHIHSGVYQLGNMARSICYSLVCLANDLEPSRPIAPETRQLLCSLSRAKKTTKRVLRLCESAVTWGDAARCLEQIAWDGGLQQSENATFSTESGK